MKTLKAFLTSGYMFCNVVCVFFVAGFLLGAVLVRHDQEILDESGVEATATIVDKYTKTEVMPGGQRNTTREVHCVDYTFPLADGTSFEGGRQIDLGIWEQVNVGDEVGLIYDPEDPHTHDSHLALYSEEQELLEGLAFAFIFLMVLLTFIGLIHSLFAARRGPAPPDAEPAA